MNLLEAAKIIEDIAQSIRENPAQFQFTVEVNITGMSGISYGGGIGIMGVAQGGGTGIQSSVSVDNAQIQIANKKGAEAMSQQIKALTDLLSSMAEELRRASPDKSKLTRMFESIKGAWVPGIITSLIGNVITALVLAPR
jgi:hypothetical protein